MRSFALVAGALVVAAAGCATTPARPPSAHVTPRAPGAPPPSSSSTPRKMKLAVLAVEKLPLPKVAHELDARLRKATVSGVSETTPQTISMEVALMQLDCGEPTDHCYGQVARHFEVDCLLWAEIERAGGRKKKKAPTTIRVLLFDAEHGSVVGRAEETFVKPVSVEALDHLISRATAARTPDDRAAPVSQGREP